MNTALWIATGLLAAVFLAAGIPKIIKPRESLQDKMSFVEDYSDTQVKAIGAIEVLGALGLILPAVTGIAEFLVPLAAAGLAVDQALAALVHARRKEWSRVPVNVVLFSVAVFIAWGRFGPYPL